MGKGNDREEGGSKERILKESEEEWEMKVQKIGRIVNGKDMLNLLKTQVCYSRIKFITHKIEIYITFIAVAFSESC